MRISWIVSCFLLSISIAFSQQPSLAGQWETKEQDQILVLHFAPDGNGTFDGTSFLYEVQGKEITATYDYGIFNYEYELKNNQLILKEGNLEHPYVFKRKLAPSSAALPTVLTKKKTIDGAIIGTWANASTSVEFLGNGTCITSDGKKKLFETSEGKLKLFFANRAEENNYSVSAHNLDMVLDGKLQHFTKKESSSSSEDMRAVKTILPELAGKWCYIASASEEAQMSQECVVLSHDGHYLFLHDTKTEVPNYLDKGEWWANVDNLYFLAENGQTDTFRISKKKHPALGYLMLNIDGRNFMSADKRVSWQ